MQNVKSVIIRLKNVNECYMKLWVPESFHNEDIYYNFKNNCSTINCQILQGKVKNMDFSKMHYVQSAVILNVKNICSALLVEVPKNPPGNVFRQIPENFIFKWSGNLVREFIKFALSPNRSFSSVSNCVWRSYLYILYQ